MRLAFALGLALFVGGGMATAAEGAKPVTAESLAARVVILANREDPDSLRIARHYAEARGVPATNIVALKLPLTEEISWREFIAQLWQPLMAELVREKWLDAIAMEPVDLVGRKKYVVNGHRIAALVTCRGVPLKIAHDPELFAEALPFTRRNEFRTNAGAVDAELSLLAIPNYPINAFVPNPFFQNDRPGVADLSQIVKVSRLDGPTAADAMALVDRALAAERTGLLGRAYIDLAQRDRMGDEWLEKAADQLEELGFDTAVDADPSTMPLGARFDAPIFYFGWYTGTVNGPFLLPGFQFPAGAIALHIHSYSASTLRLTNSGWAGPLLARGVTATVGNVYEPYLAFTHRPNLLLRALARGATLVDAAYYALQALSWQAVLLGDPLYRPFAVPLEVQLKERGRNPSRLSGYAVLRRMHQLDAQKRSAEATAMGVAAQREAPSLAVGVELARRFGLANEPESAANALGFVPLLKALRSDEWALVREAARLLMAADRPARALETWRTLLAQEAIPPELRRGWLAEAAEAARVAKDFEQATAWDTLAARLTPAK